MSNVKETDTYIPKDHEAGQGLPIEIVGHGVHQRFEWQALRCPSAIAVVDGAARLTYRELNDSANRLARHLEALGVGPEVMVGICLGRSYELIVTILAVLKAGGAYVPLDPDYPAERLAFMVRDAALSTVIAKQSVPEHLPISDSCRIVSLEAERGVIEGQSSRNLMNPVDPDGLLYVIYTSGSTGQPKGVMVTHRNVVRLFDALKPVLAFSANDVWSFYHSPAFGYSAWEIWGPLVHGGRLVIVPTPARMAPAELRDFIKREAVSVLSLTPSAFRQVMLDQAFENAESVASLRMIALSGEGVVGADLRRWFVNHQEGQPDIIDTYAITETGGQVAWRRLGPAHAASEASNMLGEVLSDTQVHLLDSQLLPVEPGTDGELCVSGPGLARGYWNRADLTGEKFVQDPIDPEQRLYRTGDRGRTRPDGQIVLIGRGDDQVKVRGFRVELGEIEAALRDHSQIKEAAVLLREDGGQAPRLVAYVAARRPERDSVRASPEKTDEAELWPSLGEYQVYDEVLYYFMTSETVRNAAYKEAIDRHVKDKVVLDIGTGQHAILARFCVEAGAKRVYAIEVLDDAYEEAAKLVQESGLGDRIIVIHGDSTTVQLPELVDVCTEGIIGNIGSSDGIIPIMNDARRWFRPDAIAIPKRCITYFAAVQLPDSLYENPRFDSLPRRYVETIFAQAGRRFDIRLCVRNFPASHIVSDTGTFEDLDFSGPIDPEEDGETVLTVTKDGRFDGFLLWTHVTTAEGVAIDYLENQQAWLPVYFPLSDQGVEVSAGDRIEASWRRTLCENGINPDYAVRVALIRSNGERTELSYTTRHRESAYLSTGIHRKLFARWEESCTSLSPEELRAFLGRRLPDYMIPGAFMFLDKLPHNANGKLDRAALPTPGSERPELATPFVEPQTTLQRSVAAIWSEVLKVEAVGLDDRFFDLGGHSLTAAQILARTAVKTGVELPLSALFEEPTVRRLSGLLSQSLRNLNEGEEELPADSISIQRRRSPGPAPLSFGQERLWFLSLLEPDSSAYFGKMYRLSGILNTTVLEKSLGEILRRHEALRATFTSSEGTPVQIITPYRAFRVPLVDLTSKPEERRFQEALRLAEEELARPFDLTTGPLIRASLIRLSEQDHLFAFAVHHIAFDGWSAGVFDRELSALYRAFSEGNSPHLPELPIQYGDYTIWQRQRLGKAQLEEHLAYWRNHLDGAPPTLELLTDHPRPARQRYHGGRHLFELSSELGAKLKIFNLRENATPFMSLLAAFQILLSRYSNQRDILVGTPVANRGSLELENLIGFFVNTLVIRADLSGNPDFREVVAGVRKETLKSYLHQDLPFEKLVGELNPERDMSRHPIFQVMFTLQNASENPLTLVNLEVVWQPAPSSTTQFDLELYLRGHGDGWEGMIGYNTDLFDAATIERLARHYQILVDMLLTEPQRPVFEVPMLPASEREQLLVEWNNTATEYPRDKCIHELFEAQVERTPDALALLFGSEKLTYRELNTRANRLAHHLRRLGVGPDVLVGLCVERSTEMVIGLLGILKAGGAYVPLDPAYPKERLDLVLSDAQAAVLLTQERLRRDLELKLWNLPVICLNTSSGTNTDNPLENPHSGVAPRNLSYAIYTSGSTGTPKGVEIEHRALVNHMEWMRTCYPVGRQDRVLSRTSISFDAAIWEFWLPLLSGAVLCLPPGGAERDPAALSDFMNRFGVSIAQFVPTLLSATLDAGVSRPNKLRLVFSGGEILSRQLAQKATSTWNVPIVNLFGPTETTIQVTHYLCPGKVPDTQTVPIGSPIWNTQIYILDCLMQPVPVGVPGEIHIGGDSLARGYHNRPELTAEKFVPDPFKPRLGNRLYRTGDLGRYLPDGNIEFLGRMDNQVKIRGFRIELGEIETALRQSEGVGEAVVVAREDSPGDRRLVAYVVGENGGDPPEEKALRKMLKAKLPDYMVPAAIVGLKELPQTPNGKVDRRALPAPERQREGNMAPRTPAEEVLCSLFAEMLKLERVGIEDNFFSLGGDSILSIVLVSRARRMGLELTPRDVFQQQTVRGLAAVAKMPEFSNQPSSDSAVAIGEVVLTPIMRRLLERGGPIDRFNQSMLLQVPESLTKPHLVAVLQTLIDGHDMLRLRVERNEEGSWGLRIAPQGAVSVDSCLTTVDLAGLEEEARHSRIQAAVQEAEGRLNPQAGQILQAVWFVGAEAGRLSLVIHHLAVDGVSWRILIPDLATAWSAVVRGEKPDIEPVGTAFRTWAQHLTEEVRTPALLAELRVWEAILERGAPLIPGAVLDPVRDTLSSARHLRIDLPTKLTSALLTAVPAAFHAQINEVLLGALAVMMASWRRARGHGTSGPVLVDLEGHGREAMDEGIDLSRTVGWFTTLYPVALDAGPIDIDEALAGGPSMGCALKRIKEQLRSIPGKGLGYGLLRYLHPETSKRLAERPEPQIGFNYLGRFGAEESKDWSLPAEAANLAGGADLAMPLAHLIDVNALTVDGSDGPCFSATWSWASAFLAESEVRSLAEGWQRALEALVRHVEQPGAGGHTSSDFPLVALSSEKVEILEAAYPSLEDVLPLSPLQEGLLFHAVYDQTGPDVYSVQIEIQIEGLMDTRRMQRAFKALVRRHANLRAAFIYEGLQRPVQVVVRDAAVPWREEDLSALDAETQDARREELRAADLKERFVPSVAPLLRVSLLRLGQKRYLLVFTHHHLLMDGWSVSVFLSELLALYRSDGDASVMPRVRPYSDYLTWLAKQNAETALATWREYFTDFEGPARLAPPIRQDSSPVVPGHCQSDLTVELSNRLKGLARERGLTLNTIIQGIWAVLLGRLTGRNDVVFGVTVSGRPPELAGVEQMLGLFINTLPLRVRLSPAEPLAALLAGIQESQARLLPFQHVGLAEIKQQAGGEELFDTLIVFENYPRDSAALTESVEDFQAVSFKIRDATHYSLSLVVVPSERLHLYLDYDPARFERATVEAISARFVRLLEEAVAAPDAPFHRLEIISPREREQLLVGWNKTGADYPQGKSFDELFGEQAARTPGTVAVECEERALSYGELDARSSEVAGKLRGLGVGPEGLVGICMERSVEMLVGLLGIMKAGGAYVPLDPTYPRERLSHIIEDAQPGVILSQKSLREGLLDGVAGVVCIEELGGLESGELPRQGERSSEGLVYVLYTSGSTGKPKGVEISHRALVNFLSSMEREPGLSAQDTLLAVTTLAFDIAGLELFLPLMVGARVVIAGSDTTRDGGKLRKLLERSGASVMQATPASWKMLLEAGWEGDGKLKILCGGEAWTQELAGELLKRSGSVWNMYGPTETTIWSAVSRVEADKPVVVGGPIANTTFYILDERHQLLPVGVPGELYIGGDSVARGYHKRPELTAEKFVSDPLQPGGRLYRTGDLARYLGEGRIEFLGRIDNQVKIRGFRIELGEIESVLRQAARVGEVAVVAREDTPGDKRLAAYVVPEKAGEIPPIKQLRDLLKQKLPDYMVPGLFVVLEKLPLTPNGKVDRRALPAPEAQVESYRAPRTPHEEVLCELFADVLDLPQVGIEDNFFSLGGHSLLVMQLVSRIRNTLGAELPARAVFEAPAVADLATRLLGAEKGGARLLRQERPKRIPLSYAQERFWFLNRLEGAAGEYKVREAFRLKGELDISALEQAIQGLVERHESLRTRFEEADGEPFQIVEAVERIALSVDDLSTQEEAPGEDAIKAALHVQTQAPFSLSRGPLWRIGVLKLGPSDHILYINWHHIVTDGWSLGLLRRDMSALYTALIEGRTAGLPELPIQYADYALWQRKQLQGQDLQRLLGYWRNQLEGSQVLELPLDHPRPPTQSHAGASASLVISDELSDQIRELSRRENSTVFMTLLAALKVLLFRYTAQEDISVGIPIANRGHAEVENLIGCILNTLVLRTRLSDGIPFRDFLHHVREVTLEAYAHQELPFEKLLEELQPDRSLNRTPLFQVFVNFTSFEADALCLPGLSVERLEYTEIEARFDLNFYIADFGKRLRLDFVYNTDLFEGSTIERMLHRFRTLLEAIVADPARKIGELSLLTSEDRRTYTVRDNRVRPDNPYVCFPLEAIEQSLATRFEEQVKTHAAKQAVKTLAHDWTYAELDRRANVIAREMLRLSPEGDQRAALLLDHDAPMVAAIFGSLKAGKTYVPLSPSHPRKRIASAISDAQPRLLVTDAANRELARDFAVGGIQLIDIEALRDDSEPVLHHVDVSPDALAYVLYTSGSTGEPKGIAGSHRNVLHHIRNYTNGLHISPHDRMLLLASYGFDAAVMDIFGALLNGATLLPFDIRKHDFVSLSGWIVTEDVTIYHSTPTVLRHFLRAIPENGALDAVRLVSMGGEPVLSQDLDLFKDRFSSRCIIVNGFGQTEYSFSLQYFANSETEIAGNSIPIGYPVDETEVALLDTEGHAGQIFGEIAIRSPYLARGYWGRPELTAAAFKEGPDGGNRKMYRTGDLGRLRVDGTIEFAGRKDFQVKIRGNRVELGEIETVLHRHPQIDSVVVVARHSPANEEELVAYVVPKNGGFASGDQLRDFLAKSLPDYMVPSTFVMLDKMPLTPNGKINRNALPLPERERSALPHVPPRTPFERTLADIWRDVLRLDKIGVRDDFFEQGGHSLIATRLVSQMREKLNVEIPIRAVFERRTIENLALYIAELQADAAGPDEIEKLLEELESLP